MFRFIHTSDWHLGQNFMNQSRESEHRLFLNWLLEQIKDNDVDCLIIAGDIFDTGTPPSYARKIYFDFLKELNKVNNVSVVIIGGNHDSISTLNESGTLLKLLDIHVIGGKLDPEEETFILKNRNGEESALICAVPFLRDRDVRLSSEGETLKSKKDALRLGIKKHYSDNLTHAKELNKSLNLPIIATGHLTTTGGELSDGVRDIYIGSLESYDANDFPDEFDYVALGHLHSKQKFGKREHIRYCGSPIPISFSEACQQKIVNLVEVSTQGQSPSVTELEIPCFRQLASIKGSLENIQKQIDELKHDGDLNSWMEIVLDAQSEITSSQAMIKDHIKDLPIDILRFRRERSKSQKKALKERTVHLKEMSIEEIFQKKLDSVDHDKKLKDELLNAFREINQELQLGNNS